MNRRSSVESAQMTSKPVSDVAPADRSETMSLMAYDFDVRNGYSKRRDLCLQALVLELREPSAAIAKLKAAQAQKARPTIAKRRQGTDVRAVVGVETVL